jgi:hypothetical protein
MIKTRLLPALVFLIVFASCKHRQKITQTETKTEVITTQVVAPDPNMSGKFRLIVSFTSKGSGIDINAKEDFDRKLSNNPKKPVFEEVHWGREGEVDYHFTLSELTPQEQNEFVIDTREFMSTSPTVIVSENAAPLHVKNDGVQDNPGKSRLLVSFISIGTGIDYEARKKFETMINDHPKRPNAEQAPWGREGEVDYYFNLSELSAQEQVEFVNKTKELLGINKRVIITENEKPLHTKKDMPPTMNSNSRLLVSFISIGQGADQQAREKFDKFLKEQTVLVNYEGINWGREGEMDYCFTLGELSPAQQAEFVKKVKALIGENKLVLISENVPCAHKK